MALSNLKEYIQKNNLNQSTFAGLCGVHRVQISRILRGERTPSVADAIAIEGVTGIPMKSWFVEQSA